MGKIFVVFLWFFIVAAFGASIQNPSQNPESNSPGEISNEFLTKMRELEEFREEFKDFKSSFVELGAAFGRFHQSLTKNGTGEMEKVSTTTLSTPQQFQNPALQHTSCSDAAEKLSSPRSKKQTIYPHGNSTSLNVLCDFETEGGGWTIIQKRSSGPQEEFSRDWDDYKNGFGLRAGNFWLGLDNIRALTKSGDQELRIELEDFEGEKRYAKYSSFSISDASDFYRLNISGYSGTAGDSMVVQQNNGQRFSTKDKNRSGGANVALMWSAGGWWFPSWSGASYLNGLYREKGETVPAYEGIIWYSFGGNSNSLAKTEMKIRKKK